MNLKKSLLHSLFSTILVVSSLFFLFTFKQYYKHTHCTYLDHAKEEISSDSQFDYAYQNSQTILKYSSRYYKTPSQIWLMANEFFDLRDCITEAKSYQEKKELLKEIYLDLDPYHYRYLITEIKPIWEKLDQAIFENDHTLVNYYINYLISLKYNIIEFNFLPICGMQLPRNWMKIKYDRYKDSTIVFLPLDMDPRMFTLKSVIFGGSVVSNPKDNKFKFEYSKNNQDQDSFKIQIVGQYGGFTNLYIQKKTIYYQVE